MKNILQLFKTMYPKSYYGSGVAVTQTTQTSWSKEDMMYTSNTGFLSSGCTELLRRGVMGRVDETTDCQNVYSSKYTEMPVQNIGLLKVKKMR